MRNNIAFRLTAQNSLRINEVTQKEQKNMMNTFKAGSDLRSQLNKAKPTTKTIKLDGTATFSKQQKRMQEEVLAQEVAALDHFKAPVSSEKTKGIIENIKLRRRQKHIDTLNRFRQDADQYKQNLYTAYDSLTNDIQQVMSIKLSSIEEYLNSCNKKEYLLSREKDFLAEVQEQAMNYKIECQTKLNYAKQELSRIRGDRSEMAADICESLRMAIVEIAFVLEPEALDIQKKQRDDIHKMEQLRFEQFTGKLQNIIGEQANRNEKVEKLTNEVINNWKTEKQEYELQKYIQQAQSDEYRRPHSLRALFNKLMDTQMENHERKIKLLNNLINEHPDSLNKPNTEKVNEAIKKINELFDANLDQLLVEFRNANNQNKQHNNSRVQQCKKRLLYIEKHNQEEVNKILEQKCIPLRDRNISQQQQLIKKATSSAQNQDQKQNKVFQAIMKFILKIAQENDNFVKQFGNLNQKYQIEKAKILDDDQQLVDKLKEELDKLKVQLRQALHHIKLQQVEKKCFEKVDQIQKAYRLCHEKNKQLKDTRTPSLQQFMKNYQAKQAEIMELFDPSRRGELEDKNKKQCEEEAQRRIQIEQKKKAEEQLKAIQQAKAKGGKPPAPAKPKDPKKAAAELEERKKAILAEIGTKKIQQIKTDTGSVWLVFKSIKQICQNFYKQALKQLSEKKQDEDKKNQQQQTKKALDSPEQEVKDCRNSPVVSDKAFMRLDQLTPLIQNLRTKIFDAVASKKQRIINQSQKIDEEMLEESLINLDDRLKAHYSLKGTIQNEIFVKRSGQITNHKKKYEKYAKTIKQKIDLQTQKFNFLLEKGLQSLKNHIAEQKNMKQHISKCKNLSQLQGMYSRTKQNYSSFGLNIKQIYSQLQRLSLAEIETLLKKNEQFIKQSKLMKDGGDYSNQEISWYEQMMSEITTQMKQQQQKRQQKLAELKQHSEKRKQQLLDGFQKQYNTTVQQLAARDGTGKKYGKPKRIALQKTRLQMNKCEQSQININQMVSNLAREYEKYASKSFKHQVMPDFLLWRKKLMTVQFCIMRYSKHIEAFKPDLKINAMIRVNYNLKNPDAKLSPQQEQQDKKRREQQLKSLGKLSEQKDDRNFIKYIEQIEKIISDESRTIYVGDKAKFITGNDKIPDFLRVYIANMKKGAQAFRVSSVRQLRQSCQKLSDLSSNLSQLFFNSHLSFYIFKQNDYRAQALKKFIQTSQKHQKMRNQNMKKLRPNLSNPACQDQLKQLDKSENQRNQQYKKSIEQIATEFKNVMFSNGQQFLSCLLNNYEFLLLLTDGFYLNQDFMKLPGDQIQEKTHLDVDRLLVMKQKGIKIDPNSQRNLRKKWEGLDYSIFNIENRKYQYKKAEQVPKDKDKKAGKKDTKDPKKQEQIPQDSDPSKSKLIQTFKTWRQKSVFQGRERIKTNFKNEFDKVLNQIIEKIQSDKKQNLVHEKKWRQIADSLYLK